jgi:hypothetical protein
MPLLEPFERGPLCHFDEAQFPLFRDCSGFRKMRTYAFQTNRVGARVRVLTALSRTQIPFSIYLIKWRKVFVVVPGRVLCSSASQQTRTFAVPMSG